MNINIKETIKKQEMISAAVTVLLYVAACAVFFLNFGGLPVGDLILRFNAAEGIQTLGTRMGALGILVMSGLLIVSNGFLARELFYRERILAMLFIWGSGLVALFTLIAMGLIVSIN